MNEEVLSDKTIDNIGMTINQDHRISFTKNSVWHDLGMNLNKPKTNSLKISKK